MNRSFKEKCISVALSISLGAFVPSAAFASQDEGNDSSGEWSPLSQTDSSKLEISNAKGLLSTDRFAEVDLPVRPSPVIQSSEEPQTRLLREGVDYTLSYEGGDAVGPGRVIATGIGNYTGTLEFPFEVEDRIDLSKRFDFWLDGTVQFYTGKPIEPKVVFYRGLVEGRDYEVNYSSNTNRGTATATVVGIGRYKGEVNRRFAIVNRSAVDLSSGARISLVDGISADGCSTYPYRGTAVEPRVVVYWDRDGSGSCELKKGEDYTVSYSGNDAVGVATVTVTGINGARGSLSKEFRIAGDGGIDISQCNLSEWNLDCREYLYTGSAVEPKLVWRDNFVEGIDYTLSYRNNKAIGTGTVVVRGIGSYTGASEIPFSIVEKYGFLQYSDVVAIDSLDDMVYTGEPLKPKPVLRDKETGEELVENRDYRVVYENNVSVGTATIHIYEGPYNYGVKYRGTATCTFNIVDKLRKKIEEPSARSLTYNGSSQIGVASGKGFVVSGGSATNAGTYDATASLNDKGNCVWAGTGKSDDIQVAWSIAPADIGMTSVSKVGAQVWTGSQVAPDLDVSFNGVRLVEGSDYVLSYGDNIDPGIDAGSVTVSAVEGGNFTGTLTVRFDIEKQSEPVNPGPTLTFPDVDYSSWYGSAVSFVTSKGLITGYADSGLFGVGDTLTRAQLATILYRNANPGVSSDSRPSNTTGMPDVKGGEWYTAGVNWAVENGVINGYADEQGNRFAFGPDDPVTFEQLITVLANCSAKSEDLPSAQESSKVLSSFKDGQSVSAWAQANMAWAVGNGLVSGYDEPDGQYLRPGEDVARERVAVILMRAFQSGILK